MTIYVVTDKVDDNYDVTPNASNKRNTGEKQGKQKASDMSYMQTDTQQKK